MAGESLSPNMNLILPGVGVTLGPLWATDLNNSLLMIDAHTHASGSGVQITPDGLNITSALTMANNNLTNVKSVQYYTQLSAITDLRSSYVVSKDLYFTDGDGNNVRITQSGGVAGSPGSISNLTSPASASYVAGSSKFLWQSNTNTPAIMDSGYLILRNISTSGYGLTLTPPTLSSNYTITLPSLPASQKIMTLDASGNMSAPYAVDNSTIEISSNTIQVKDAGITLAKMASASVGASQIVAGSVTQVKMGSVGQQVSSSCGSFTTGGAAVDVTNLTCTITTTGRPVMILMQGNASALSYFGVTSSGASAAEMETFIKRDSTTISRSYIASKPSTTGTSEMLIPPSALAYLDVVGAGTYTYKIQTTSVTGTCNFNECKLVVYEI